ncbi:MAG: zinc-binding dehydrogenase [Nakamurella sp.]
MPSSAAVEIPAGVDYGDATATTAAGVTALQAVRRLGSILHRRVLITGASGGVGRFAVQLAALAGAEVIACVGSVQRGSGLEQIGAEQIVVGEPDAGTVETVDAVIDLVGGSTLNAVAGLSRPGGLVLTVGMASGEASAIDWETLRNLGGRTIEAFALDAGSPFASDLTTMLHLLASGRIDAQIGWRGSWTRFDEAVSALAARKVLGKVVLDIQDAE